MYTSRFNYKISANDYVGVGIAVGKPRWKPKYECEHYSPLAPWGLFKKYTGDEFKERYILQLEKLGTTFIRKDLQDISNRHGGKDVVLLCWEDLSKGLTCHRRYFAEWWEKLTGEKIDELEEVLHSKKEPVYVTGTLF